MMRLLLALLLLACAGGPARAAELDRPDAFEHGFAVSLFVFDGCGDAIAGRLFRRALAEKFAHCPFTPAARSQFAQRTRAQQAKTRRALAAMIESRGGLPVQLDGMATTCHAQQAGEEYRQLRTRLDGYADGSLGADAIIPAPCDAADMAP